jgi:hypothetical protein
MSVPPEGSIRVRWTGTPVSVRHQTSSRQQAAAHVAQLTRPSRSSAGSSVARKIGGLDANVVAHAVPASGALSPTRREHAEQRRHDAEETEQDLEAPLAQDDSQIAVFRSDVIGSRCLPVKLTRWLRLGRVFLHDASSGVCRAVAQWSFSAFDEFSRTVRFALRPFIVPECSRIGAAARAGILTLNRRLFAWLGLDQGRGQELGTLQQRIMSDLRKDGESRRGAATCDLMSNRAKPRIGRPDDPGQMSPERRQGRPKARHPRKSMPLQRLGETFRTLPQAAPALQLEYRRGESGLSREQGLGFPGSDERLDPVVAQPSGPFIIDRGAALAFRWILETRVGGDDGDAAKALRLCRDQSERETPTQRISDDLVNIGGQCPQNAADAALERLNERPALAVPGQVDRE